MEDLKIPYFKAWLMFFLGSNFALLIVGAMFGIACAVMRVPISPMPSWLRVVLLVAWPCVSFAAFEFSVRLNIVERMAPTTVAPVTASPEDRPG